MKIVKRNVIQTFEDIPKSYLWDTRLSYKARGLLGFLLDTADDYDYSITSLTKCAIDGRASVRSAIKELKEMKYIEVQQTQDVNGHFYGNQIIVYACLDQ